MACKPNRLGFVNVFIQPDQKVRMVRSSDVAGAACCLSGIERLLGKCCNLTDDNESTCRELLVVVARAMRLLPVPLLHRYQWCDIM